MNILGVDFVTHYRIGLAVSYFIALSSEVRCGAPAAYKYIIKRGFK